MTYYSDGTCKVSECDSASTLNRAGRYTGRCEEHRSLTSRHRGEEYVSTQGYRMVTVGGVRVAEHRHVMERTLGRPLAEGENVHHINGDRLDNRPENLELWYVPQPYGQRVEQLLAYAVDEHAELLKQLLGCSCDDLSVDHR